MRELHEVGRGDVSLLRVSWTCLLAQMDLISFNHLAQWVLGYIYRGGGLSQVTSLTMVLP